MMLNLFALLGLISLCIRGVKTTSHTNFHIRRLESCGSSGRMKLQNIKIVEKDGKQYLSFDFLTTVPLDENIGVSCFIHYAADGKTFLPLFKIQEKYMCTASNRYMGEFWYDLQRAGQITPGACPVPAKHYHIHNFLADFRKIALQTFPFGKLKFTVGLTDNKKAQTLLCMLLEVENVIN